MLDKLAKQHIFPAMNGYGMTIIEIMAAVAVISILSAIAVSAVISLLPDYRLKAAVSDLYSNLQRAKQEAVRSNGECGVYFDAATNRYHVIAGGPDGVCDGPPAGLLPQPLNDDILINYIELSNYGSGVRFGSGMAEKTVPGAGIPPAVTVSYVNDRIRFNAKGMAREMGYTYLTNINGSAFAVGTPSIAGSIVQKKWQGNSWE
jgi:prepilin-type N-terminal cleavage/methylation domain-containing protein